MAPEFTPSTTLLRAAQADRARLARALARNAERQARLEAEIGTLEAERRKLEERDRLLQSLDGDEPRRTAEAGGEDVKGSPHEVLRGAQIREHAARLFYRRHGADVARHYRHWFDLLVESGVEISGKDPIATFLTNLNRSPVVVRGEETGTYAIDEQAPRRLKAELGELNAELVDLAGVIARTDDPPQDLLDHRAELLSAIRKDERLLAEAERVLDRSMQDGLAAAA